MLRKKPSRLTRTSHLISYGTFYLLGASVILFGVLFFIGVNLDRNLAITGTFFGIVQYLLSRYESRNPKQKNVVFLAKSNSSFAQSIYKGLRKRLESNQNIRISPMFPSVSADPEEQLAWQIKELSSNAMIARCDALVIIPTKNDLTLWQSLVPLADKGITVIVVDTRPTESVFNNAKVERPYFVSSDFNEGGEILGQLITEELDKEELIFIGSLGPRSSAPAIERCSSLLIALAFAGYLNECIWAELLSWDRNDCVEKLIETLEMVENTNKKYLVFCGNDKVAINFIRKLPFKYHDLVKVIGYDGLRDEADLLRLAQEPTFFATIDTLPLEQGMTVGSIIENLYHGESSNQRHYCVTPALIKG